MEHRLPRFVEGQASPEDLAPTPDPETDTLKEPFCTTSALDHTTQTPYRKTQWRQGNLRTHNWRDNIGKTHAAAKRLSIDYPEPHHLDTLLKGDLGNTHFANIIALANTRML